MRVGVLGAGGRMGVAVCQALAQAPDLELVAAVDPKVAGAELSTVAGVGGTDLRLEAGVEALGPARAEVAVDFTRAEAAMENLRWCAGHGVHGVVGTTGLSAPDLAEVARLFAAEIPAGAATDSGPDAASARSRPNCIIAPNFAIGAVLMMHFAALAAPFVDSAEVVELHHDAKVDAPSGTAMRTAELLARSRQAAGKDDFAPDPTAHEALEGARGGAGPGNVRVHSVRLRGLVAHQEVLLGTLGQSLTIRHDSYDRTSFMPGVLLAVRRVAELPGVTVGIERLLGLVGPGGETSDGPTGDPGGAGEIR